MPRKTSMPVFIQPGGWISYVSTRRPHYSLYTEEIFSCWRDFFTGFVHGHMP